MRPLALRLRLPGGPSPRRAALLRNISRQALEYKRAAREPRGEAPGQTEKGRGPAMSRASDGVRRAVRVEGFEPVCLPGSADRAALLRRCSSLILDDACARRGGQGRVGRAVNAKGEPFAVKVYAPIEAAVDASGGRACQAELARDAFEREREALGRLAGVEGFPRLYGCGMVAGEAALVMEWIDGETLDHAARALAADDEGRLSPLMAAQLGRDLFAALARMAAAAPGLAQGDLSAANVMVDTACLSLVDQAQRGAFDLRIVDFGSSSSGARREALPAEGLADAGAVGGAVLAEDVRVAAGIVCRLACGGLARGVPAEDGARLGEALALVDTRLAEALLPCLAADPAGRPSAAAVRDALTALCRQRSGNARLVRRDGSHSSAAGGPGDATAPRAPVVAPTAAQGAVDAVSGALPPEGNPAPGGGISPFQRRCLRVAGVGWRRLPASGRTSPGRRPLARRA